LVVIEQNIVLQSPCIGNLLKTSASNASRFPVPTRHASAIEIYMHATFRHFTVINYIHSIDFVIAISQACYSTCTGNVKFYKLFLHEFLVLHCFCKKYAYLVQIMHSFITCILDISCSVNTIITPTVDFCRIILQAFCRRSQVT
jgi:hypothetical protein